MRASMNLDVTRGFVKTPHGHIEYREVGAGEPLVVLHSTPNSSAQYQELFPYLSGHYRVIAPTTLGYGDSDRPPHPYHHGSRVLGVTPVVPRRPRSGPDSAHRLEDEHPDSDRHRRLATAPGPRADPERAVQLRRSRAKGGPRPHQSLLPGATGRRPPRRHLEARPRRPTRRQPERGESASPAPAASQRGRGPRARYLRRLRMGRGGDARHRALRRRRARSTHPRAHARDSRDGEPPARAPRPVRGGATTRSRRADRQRGAR